MTIDYIMVVMLKKSPIIIIAAFAVIFTAWTITDAIADSFDDAIAAYNLKDYQTALHLLLPLAESENAKAESLLGNMYAHGQGVGAQDYIEAVNWYQKAARTESLLGDVYAHGQSAEDYVEAVNWYRKAAEQGNPKAQNYLAEEYYNNGKGVTKDYAEAVQAYRRNDYKAALRLLQPIAEQGNANAEALLGKMYYYGLAVPKDYAESVKWYRKAAEHGNAKAQFNLGVAYYEGKGITKDSAEAVNWYRKAAEQGFALAEYNVGLACITRFPIPPQDKAEEVKWHRKAAEQGESMAQSSLAIAYNMGKGVPKDNIQAYVWANLAEPYPYEEHKLLDTIAAEMTPEQIDQAQRLSVKWMQQHLVKAAQ